MEISPIAKKLRIKENYGVALLSCPTDCIRWLEPLPKGVSVDQELKKKYDFILFFVIWKKDLDPIIPKIKGALRPDGLIWIAYPKGTSKKETDLNRDKLFDILAKHRMKAVAQIAIDPVWSAMRFKTMR